MEQEINVTAYVMPFMLIKFKMNMILKISILSFCRFF